MKILKKQVEEYLAQEFLEKCLGLSVCQLVGQHPPQPDIFAKVERNRVRTALEVELVEYHVDTQRNAKGGSPGARLNSLWRKVQDNLYQLMKNKPLEVDVRVTLKSPNEFSNVDTRHFAAELVQLAGAIDFSASKIVYLESFPPQYPLLRQYVQNLMATKVNFYSLFWACSNVSFACVGLLPNHVAALVQKKANKTYKWAPNGEKWLLVCASGDSIVGTAGPRPLSEEWRDSSLSTICNAAPFDRVFFWDRVHSWQKLLK